MQDQKTSSEPDILKWDKSSKLKYQNTEDTKAQKRMIMNERQHHDIFGRANGKPDYADGSGSVRKKEFGAHPAQR